MACPELLRCEYAENPIGVQVQQPVLEWRFTDPRPGGRQTAYQIAAASTLENLESGNFDRWDSGKTADSRFCGIPYGGGPLSSAERIYWKVRIWDEQDQASEYSAPAYFEMGLLNPSDWKGRWMGFLGGLIGNGLQMRYSFSLPERPVKARAYIAGLGYYELRMNGRKVGDKLLDPGATDTSKTVLYSAYDVTEILQKDLNVAGIILGTGWQGTPKVLFQLNVEFADGSRKEFFTDWGIGWCVAKGPILYNSIYDGEDYDARLEKDGWDTPEYEDQFQKEHQRSGGWTLGTVIEPPGGELVGELLPPIRVTEQRTPAYIGDLPDGRKLYDSGVNLSGWVRMKLRGTSGSRIRLTFAEQLNENGDLDMSYLRSARCQDSYILRGDLDAEEYAPRFTYHGFRYFTVETEGEVEILSFTTEFVRSDLPKNAVVDSGDPFLNKLADVMWHTDACNLHSIPTDCCQRDERHGWTTDTTSRAEGCTYHFDMSGFFNKWARDIRDTQDSAGYFADTAPHRWGRRPCDPQVNTPVSLPLLLYRVYGNRRVLEDGFDGLKRYLAALKAESDNLLISRTGFGEWACPRSECYPEPFGAGAVSRHVTPTLVSTGYFFRSAKELAEIARILGRDSDANDYEALAASIRERYNERFFHPDTCQYDTGSQSSNALSIALGLAPEESIPKVVQNLVNKIREYGYHFTTGNMGTKAVLEVLCEYGMEDVAYEIMVQKTSPSMGYMLEKGATSIWERWEADQDNNIMNSHNHPMLSSCCVWYYKYLGGIRPQKNTEAFRELLIAPAAPSQLRHVHTECTIPAGRVVTDWTRDENGFRLETTLPFNTSAVVEIPKRYAPLGKLQLDSSLSAEDAGDCYRIPVSSGSAKFQLL